MPFTVQLTPIVNRRDGIGRLAFNISRLLSDHGQLNLILTERQESFLHWGPVRRGLLREPKSWRDLKVTQPSTVIYHHSIGTRVADHFLNLPARKKIVIYHGVTTPELLAESQREDAVWGARQLEMIARSVDHAFAFSDFTGNELRRLGCPAVTTVPYYFPEVVAGKRVRSKTILVVGRVVKHKRVLECLEAFQKLAQMDGTVRLLIIGSLRGDPDYAGTLREFVASHFLSRRVKFLGKISDRHLLRLYYSSSILLSLSEHEGFCIPIVEALRAGLAVVATRDGALKETLGTVGLAVESRDPDSVAQALRQALERPTTGEVAADIASHLLKFEPGRFEIPFLKAVLA
ncbi:MAG: glycosyltransferase family 4 protein [Deltaproteobacteria bacterium]|nr:glycosyltransferase family 4 protein [Deltaproteobacteria bacterium]MBI3294220.1 glycosyltransferase family 4 protein [Deltaproteobacteria bacterium]